LRTGIPTKIPALAAATAGVAVAAVVGSVTSAYPGAATFPGKRGQIAFISDRLDQEVFVVNADGSGVRELSRDPASATGPVPSPDGESIAFTSTRHGNREVYIMGADGSAQRRLTRDPATDVVHDWSPDGSELAVVSNRVGTPQIYALRADGTGTKQLTAGSAASDDPAWSPEGRRIAFVRSREIWIMGADGTDQHRLTRDPVSAAADPAWAPDGSKIAFVRTKQGHPFDTVTVNTMTADGTVVRTIYSSAFAAEPAWSPDGRRLALRVGSSIFLMNADGSDRSRLTDLGNAPDEPGDDAPRWLGDGRRIAFTRSVGGFRHPQLYLVSATGERPRRLTNEVGGVTPADWSPDGRMLVLAFSGEINLLAIDSGRSPRRLVRGTTPAWAPDGKKIVFARRDGLYLTSAAGGRVRKLAHGGHSPAWAPNGRSILFVRGAWPETSLWTIRPDGRAARRLPIRGAEAPEWSPDGRKIVFGDGQQIRVANADGSGARPLSRGAATRSVQAEPTWSPDGRRIAYERLDSIWIVNADGSRARPIVRSQLGDTNRAPDWQSLSR